MSLPYSPEFELREDPDEGEKTLREIARVTGGVERTTWDDVFDPHRLAGRQVRDLVLPRVVEIAGRRLLWFDAARSWLRAVRLRRLGRAVARAPVPSTPSSELRPSRDPARRVWQAVLTSPVR